MYFFLHKHKKTKIDYFISIDHEKEENIGFDWYLPKKKKKRESLRGGCVCVSVWDEFSLFVLKLKTRALIHKKDQLFCIKLGDKSTPGQLLFVTLISD